MADPNANFVEKKNILADKRWYSSNQVLEDGSAVIAGGRNSFSYEIKPLCLRDQAQECISKTSSPDGNVFLFANDRGIIFHPHTGTTVRQFPKLHGGARNYPASCTASLLSLTITPTLDNIHAEVVVCSGKTQDAYPAVDSKHKKNRAFTPALRDCHRIVFSNHDSTWEKEEDMSSGQCMGDLVHLSNGNLLRINGARKGVAG
ncbi:hypothetical protein R6Q59_006682 [Mikania micrantha]